MPRSNGQLFGVYSKARSDDSDLARMSREARIERAVWALLPVHRVLFISRVYCDPDTAIFGIYDRSDVPLIPNHGQFLIHCPDDLSDEALRTEIQKQIEANQQALKAAAERQS